MDYQQNIVIDLEFNPVTKGHAPRGVRSEVIEVGAVRLDRNGQVNDTFSALVRPTFEQKIFGYIVRLTRIQNSSLEDAPHFQDVFEDFRTRVGAETTCFITWGNSDERVFSSECGVLGIDVPENMRRWMDLQRVYTRMMKLSDNRRSHLALRRVAEWGCDDFNERDAHRALYDAEKTAELAAQLLDGSYRVQREKMRGVITSPESHAPLSSSLRSQFPELAAFREKLAASA